MMTPELRLLWAKSEPFHPLWKHLVDAGCVCEALLPHFGDVPGLTREWTVVLVALHDLGKADPEFQCKDAALAQRLRDQGLPLPDGRTRFRHEAQSSRWLRGWLRRDLGWSRPSASVVCEAIRGHHGDFGAELQSTWTGDPEVWSRLRAELAHLVVGLFHPPSGTPEPPDDSSATGVLLSGIIVLSDWIASNPELFHYPGLGHDTSPEIYLAQSRAEARRVVAALDFSGTSGTCDGATPAFTELFPGFAPRPIQALLDQRIRERGIATGLVIIEDRMGQGKTEAALHLIEHWSRVRTRRGAYLALPTGATSNQMHRRYHEFLRASQPADAAPRLIHGMAWLAEADSPADTSQTYGSDDERLLSREWFRSTRRALLAQHGVGTVDQALMAALNVRFGFLRLFGLSRKVLLVDEVHAYDEYMTVILERLLAWCRCLRIPVILLSATLSQRQKARLAAAYRSELPATPSREYPLVTLLPMDGPAEELSPSQVESAVVTIGIELHPGGLEDPAGTAALASGLVRDGGCCCVLMNTVAAAQEVYRHLAAPGGCPAETELVLFHARFTAGQRRRLERLVGSRFGKSAGKDGTPPRPHRAILVATQVVEQSLDVDFDVMVTQIAPVDLLLQRAGRLHRHCRARPESHRHPILHVLLPHPGEPDFGSSGLVYDDKEPLLRSYALLLAAPSLRLPDDFRRLIGACYDGGDLPDGILTDEELRVAENCRIEHQVQAKGKAKRCLVAPPSSADFALALCGGEVTFEEAEEGSEASSFFRAQTRLSDQSTRVLVLHGESGRGLLSRASAPGGRTLRRLMLNQAGIPRWWIREVDPEPGYEPIAAAPDWLRGHRILRLRDGVWRGRDRSGRPRIIRSDTKLGLFIDQGVEEYDPVV